MRAATGLSFADLSTKLTRMAVGLIVAHPLAYLGSVAKVHLRFWSAPIYWDVGELHPAFVQTVAKGLWKAERPLLVLLNVVFLVLAAREAIRLLRRRRQPPSDWQSRARRTAMAAVLVGSLPSAFLAYGENGRYAFPFFGLVVISVAVALGSTPPVVPPLSDENAVTISLVDDVPDEPATARSRRQARTS
jgi:hypothetical protein